MAARDQDHRRKRAETVIVSAARHQEFSLAQLKMQLREVQPTFITRTIRRLADDGHLQATRCGGDARYRWRTQPTATEIARWLNASPTGPTITNSPANDRPRERLLRCGASQLKTAELLALLIRSGRPGESAVQAGEKISAAFADRLGALANAGRGELKQVSIAVGDAAYCQIMAAIELGKRIAEDAALHTVPMRITNVADAKDYCRGQFARLAKEGVQEEFHIVCLDTKNQILATHRISIGTLDASLVHPREVFRPAIKDAAASVILVHNHPSGDPTPSAEDRKVTERLVAAGKTLGMDVLDHLIVAGDQVQSIRNG